MLQKASGVYSHIVMLYQSVLSNLRTSP